MVPRAGPSESSLGNTYGAAVFFFVGYGPTRRALDSGTTCGQNSRRFDLRGRNDGRRRVLFGTSS
eukprot:1061942-Rhodomonas_salina.1